VASPLGRFRQKKCTFNEASYKLLETLGRNMLHVNGIRIGSRSQHATKDDGKCRWNARLTSPHGRDTDL
jgi:hypothetical protein